MAAIGWVGLGKLGDPCATALAEYGGHDVMGYDVVPRTSKIKVTESLRDVVEHTDSVVYVAVQTPHAPAYGGETKLSENYHPVDFEYHYLTNAVSALASIANELHKRITIVIVSTVLPGTVDRDIRPVLNEFTGLVYHPFFIAMGTTVEDFIKPEFTLLGADRESDARAVLALYAGIHNAPARIVSIASAELTKVAYNTFISTKVVFANSLAEMCEYTGADVDEVTGSLAFGTDRIISTRYLSAGMGDGGACHPRDNIALSALARRYGLSVDLMGYLTLAREAHTEWLSGVAIHWMSMTGLPLTVLGKAYKPGVDSTAGSPALLLADILAGKNVEFAQTDHLVDRMDNPEISVDPQVFFLATYHPEYAELDFPAGSVVIDPFGYIRQVPGVTLVTPGRKHKTGTRE